MVEFFFRHFLCSIPPYWGILTIINNGIVLDSSKSDLWEYAMLFYNLAILIKGKQIVHISSKVWGSEHRCLQICDIKLKVLICHNWNLYILIVTFRMTTYNQQNKQNKQNVRRAWKCLRCPEDSAFIGPSFLILIMHVCMLKV